MIKAKERGVARFFVPMVDVMMLLFSIFLLMPILGSESAQKADTANMTRKELASAVETLRPRAAQFDAMKKDREDLAKDVKRLQEEVKRLTKFEIARNELEKLKKDINKLRTIKREELSARLFVRMLEIDPNDGNLFYYEGTPPQRKPIKTAGTAKQLILDDRAKANKNGRELFYFFLMPRVDSGFPNTGQERRYKRWFSDAAYYFK